MNDKTQGASHENPRTPPPSTLLDRSDVRVKHATGVGGTVAAFVERVRSGDLGSLPVIAGLVIIWTVFTSLNPVFLSANNMVNLLFDCSTVGVISLGIVCVLMVGQIDLSVGSMSGFASALVGTLWVNHGWPVLLAIVAAVATLFASFSSPFLTATFTVMVFVIGRSSDTLAHLPKKMFGETVARGFAAMARVVPNLHVYVPARPLLLGQVADQAVWRYVGVAAIHAAFYATALLVVGALAFRKRDFS